MRRDRKKTINLKVTSVEINSPDTYSFTVANSIFIPATGLAYILFSALCFDKGAETFHRFLGTSQIILTSVKRDISIFFDKFISVKGRSTMTASWRAIKKELDREINISSIFAALKEPSYFNPIS